MESERHFELYLRVLQRWGTPSECEHILKKVGSPEDVERWIAAFDEWYERDRWWVRFWARVREGLIWVGLLGGALGAVIAARAVYTFLQGS